MKNINEIFNEASPEPSNKSKSNKWAVTHSSDEEKEDLAKEIARRMSGERLRKNTSQVSRTAEGQRNKCENGLHAWSGFPVPSCKTCFIVMDEITAARNNAARKERGEANKREAEEKERLRRQSEIQKAIPFKYLHASFDSFDVEYNIHKIKDKQKVIEGKGRAYKILKEYAEELKDNRKIGHSLILDGTMGTSKTYLSFCVMRFLMEEGLSVVRRNMSDILREIKCTYGKLSEKTTERVIGSFISPDLLIVDEVGRQRGTAEETLLIHEIFNSRYEASKPVIVISNWGEQGMADCLGENIWERLKEGGTRIIFEWESAR